MSSKEVMIDIYDDDGFKENAGRERLRKFDIL